MPSGEGNLPPLHAMTGEALVRMSAQAAVHHVVGSDELEQDDTQDAWHTFVDLMQDVADNACSLDVADRRELAKHVDAAIADLQRVRAHVVAGTRDRTMFVAVIAPGDRRDLRAMFLAA